MGRLAVAVLLLSAALAEAQVKKGSSVRITRQNGKVVLGTVQAETSTGFLITNGNKTELIPFTEIASVDDLTPQPEAAPPPTPPPAAPPPLVSSDPAPATEPAPAPKSKKGFLSSLRFGGGALGIAGMSAPTYGWLYSGLSLGFGIFGGAAYEFWDRWSLRVFLEYSYRAATSWHVHAFDVSATQTLWLLELFGGWYGVGAGVQLGFAANSDYRGGAGPNFGLLASPVRFKFGKAFQHEIALDGGFTFCTGDLGAALQARLGYTLLFSLL